MEENPDGTAEQMMRVLLTLIAALSVPLSAQAVTIDTVLIGDPGNAPDLQSQGLFGRVTSTYRIGTTEVTNAQYAEFLNSVAASDPYGLYDTFMSISTRGGIERSGASGSYTYAVKAPAVGQGPGGTDYSYGNKPVVFVTWYDAIRFVNWLHNGQGSGDTENGAYSLVGGTPTPSNADSVTRSSGANWFLPTESEWYKAAYYDGNSATYFDYPTSSNTAPDNNLPANDTGNSANFLIGPDTTTGNLDYPYTGAGAYTASASPYGTFDQAGNVWEWNETLIGAEQRGRRGGAWNSGAAGLAASTQGNFFASLASDSVGFRVASIPDPGGLAGDFNGDDSVDAIDYVLWRKNLGTPEAYNEWRANFGMTASGGGSLYGTSIPEPTSILLFLVGLMALLPTRHTR